MAKCSSCGRNIGFTLGKKLCRWCVEHEAAQRGDLGEDQIQRVMPTPWKSTGAIAGGSFNQLFIGINVLVFLAMIGTGIPFTGPSSEQMIHWGANFGPLTLGAQPWRLFTYMFLHGGIIHIGMNMWCLWNLGELAESLYGDWLYALIYVLSGLGGGILSVAWHPGTVSVGASGAVFGVAGALLASLKLGDFSIPRPMILGTYRSILIFAGYSLLFGAVSRGTDNACHIGGLLTGLGMGSLVAVSAPERDRVFMRLGICVAVVALLAGAALWVVNTRGYVVIAQHASQLLRQGKVDEAIPELQRALQHEPNNIEIHWYLAHAYMMKSQHSQAESELQRILALDHNNNAARYNLGMVYINQGKLADARKTFMDMLTLNPKDADAHHGLGALASAEGNHESAVAEYKQAVELDPEDGDYYSLGMAYMKLKKPDDAIAAFKLGQEMYYDSRIDLALAEAYRAKGMTKEADAATAKAAQMK
jgi:rhomboid protease GluP